MSFNPKHRNPYARFLRWFCMMLGGYFLLTAVLSLTVDPWRINASPFAIDSFDPYREISETVRTGKAALANKGDWETVIIGSSRMEIAFDPENPALPGKRRVNLAMAAATLTETVAVAHYTMDRNPGIQTMLFGIEAGDLHSEADSRKFTNFYVTPFSDNNRSIERSINQVIGGRSLADSIATIRNRFSEVIPKRNNLGFWIQPDYPPDLRAYVENAFANGYRESGENWNLRSQDLRKDKVESLSKLIRRARRAGIDLHLVLPPQHALKMIHPSENQPELMAWETDLRELARICKEANAIPCEAPPVKLWSFLLFNKQTCVALPLREAGKRQLSGWTDLSHARPEIGNLAIGLMFRERAIAGAADGFTGINLLVGDWQSHRSTWIQAHREYCISNKNDVDWWRALLKASEPIQHPASNSR